MSYAAGVLRIGWVSVLAQLRRLTTTALLVLLPLVLYAAMRTSGTAIGVAALGVGVAWSLATLSAFTVRSSLALDARLVLSGLRVSRIFAGRLLSLLGLAVVTAAILAVVVPVLTPAVHAGTVLVGLLMSGGVAVGVGLALGVLLPGEMEAVLIVIGAFGVPLGLSLGSTALRFAPGYGSISYLQYLGTRDQSSWFVHSGLVFLGAVLVAYCCWSRITRRASALR